MSSLVTGCSGFIGKHLVRELLLRGDTVCGVDRRPSAELAQLQDVYPKRLILLWGDLVDEAVCRTASLAPSTVYHLAAQADINQSVREPVCALADDLTTTVNILEEAARSHRPTRVVIASSAAVYGGSGQESVPSREESATGMLLSPYAIHKRACEQYAEMYLQTRNVSTVCLRYFNVYGPGQTNPRAVVPALTRSLLQDEAGAIMGDGCQTRDYVYVDDVVRATIMIGEGMATGCMNVATGNCVDVLGLAAALERVTGKTLMRVDAPAPAFDVRYSCADIGRIRAMGWAPAVELEEGLRRTVEYYRDM